MAKELNFETSVEFKRRFIQEYDSWKKRTGGSLRDLAALCGVSPAYLTHINRYGRVPSKPVMILLALNFDLEKPEELFRLGIRSSPWPYPSGVRLSDGQHIKNGFISLQVDLPGLSNSIRDIIRAELKPRTLTQVTGGRAIRIGYNTAQSVFFKETGADPKGYFPALTAQLMRASNLRFEARPVDFREALAALESGDIDLYGPMYTTPPRLQSGLSVTPFCRVPILGLGRKKAADGLDELGSPRSLDDLLNKPYSIGVLKDSACDHFAQAHLSYGSCKVLSFESPEELLERLTLTHSARPLHLMLCDSFIAQSVLEEKKLDLTLLFKERKQHLGYLENSILVRSDWPELKEQLDRSLDHFQQDGLLSEYAEENIAEDYNKLMKF